MVDDADVAEDAGNDVEAGATEPAAEGEAVQGEAVQGETEPDDKVSVLEHEGEVVPATA